MKAGRYKKRIGSVLVWFTVERLNIYNEKSRLYEEGDYVCYYSLAEPETASIGELIKDKDNKPITWKTEALAISNAKSILENFLNK